MKKEWYTWSRSASMPRAAAVEREAAASPGCMGSMMHYLLFAPGAGCVGRPPLDASAADLDVSFCHNKGLEAPRNSLELDGEELKDIQIGVQIVPAFDALATSTARHKATVPSSETETPRTPSLVARLMGIDGLPEQPSPSLAVKKPAKQRVPGADAAKKEEKKRVILESMNWEPRQPLRSLSCNVLAAGEARSLPETPRASTSSARASWDMDHRPSLQALKENINFGPRHDLSLPTSPTSSSSAKKKDGLRWRHERTTEHAREIVKQAKEAVTNRKARKAARAADKENTNSFLVEDKLVQKSKPRAPNTQLTEPHVLTVPVLPKPPPPPPPLRAKPSRPPPPPPPLDPPRPATPAAVKCKKPDGCERFATRAKKPPASHTPPAATPPPAPASSIDSSGADSKCGTTRPVPPELDPEHRYVRTVLERGGFMRTLSTPVKGYSAAKPVDPIVFHLLELELPADKAQLGPLRHRWNRKLLFHLVQETLADLLLGLDAGPRIAARTGLPLLRTLWAKIRSFPAADCQVVGDIDALVASDLAAAPALRWLASHPAVAQEASDVAADVAELVLGELLGDAAESLSVTAA